jgi:peptidoglycan biosynthesis protein MviN/MurJ (putative lipid II flippase)
VRRGSPLLLAVGRVAPWQLVSRGGAALLPILLATWFGRSEATDLYSLMAAIFVLAGSMIFACFQDSALVRVVLDVERADRLSLPALVGALLAYTLLCASLLAAVVGVGAFAGVRAKMPPALAPLVAPMAAGFSLYLFGLALRSLFSSLLAARFRFVTESVGVAFGASATIGLALALRPRGIAAIPFALGGGEMVAALILFACLSRAGLRVRLNWRRSPALGRLARLVASEIGGAAVVRANPLVDQLTAQALAIVGGGTMLRLSGDLGHAGASLLGPLFLSILLSHLAMAGVRGDYRDFRATLARSLWTVSLLLGTVAVVACLAREPLVRLVYGRGAMDAAALARIAGLLPYHLAGLAPLGALMVLARAHVSLGNSRILVGMGALNAALNLILNLILSRFMGLEGIALSTSIVNTLVALVFWLRLRGVLPSPEAQPSPPPVLVERST